MARKTTLKRKRSGSAGRRKNAAPRRKRARSVFVRNFTGTISQNGDKTVSVVGRGRRGRG